MLRPMNLADMSPDQRDLEIAEILACGVLRLHKRRCLRAENAPDDGLDSAPTCLDESRPLSLTVPTG